MTPSNYQNAVELNNEGVSCLEDGSFNVAHAYFKRALDTMTDVITLHGEVECVDGEESTVKFLWSDNPRCALHETPHQFGLSFLYSRALYISAPKQREKPEGNDESAAIVYNLGLSFHLIGNEDGSKSLATAMKFYEIASAIRSRKAATKIGILDLAILNNVGQICMEALAHFWSKTIVMASYLMSCWKSPVWHLLHNIAPKSHCVVLKNHIELST